VLVGPGSAVAMAAIQASTGLGFQPLVPGIFLLLVTGFLSIQIKAARIHTSVELTPDYLRQGTETIRLSEVVTIFPEAGVPKRRSGNRPVRSASWRACRAAARASGSSSREVEWRRRGRASTGTSSCVRR